MRLGLAGGCPEQILEPVRVRKPDRASPAFRRPIGAVSEASWREMENGEGERRIPEPEPCALGWWVARRKEKWWSRGESNP